MQQQYTKYAKLLLEVGLNLEKNMPLVITFPVTAIEFVRVLTKEAAKIGVSDIYYDFYDDDLKYNCLNSLPIENLKKSPFWNRKNIKEYVKKDAAFLYLIESNPIDIKINQIKYKEILKFKAQTNTYYRKKQANNEVYWCVAAVSTPEWAKELNISVEDLWNKIFEICYINEENPCTIWKNKIQENHKICEKLTNLKIKTLHYTNKLGTDLTITIPKNAIWCGGSSYINNKELMLNIPSEEVFTIPHKNKTTGVVYCEIPLISSSKVIKGIYLKFKNGKVIDYNCQTEYDELKNIIELDRGTSMLGEVALVDKNSPIAKTNMLFYETLFDENASCHIALGQSFKECLENGNNLSKEELKKAGYNTSKGHTDIMIGTNDLNITAKTYDNKEINIFKNGSFNI